MNKAKSLNNECKDTGVVEMLCCCCSHKDTLSDQVNKNQTKTFTLTTLTSGLTLS